MQRVDVYVESDSTAPRAAYRRAGYVLEYIRSSGTPATIESFDVLEGTYHAVILRELLSAAGRLKRPCEVNIHTQDMFVLATIDRSLDTWAARDFRTVRGEPVANREEWKTLWELTRIHLLTVEPGNHTYFKWMQEEMKNRFPGIPPELMNTE